MHEHVLVYANVLRRGYTLWLVHVYTRTSLNKAEFQKNPDVLHWPGLPVIIIIILIIIMMIIIIIIITVIIIIMIIIVIIINDKDLTYCIGRDSQ